MEAVGVTLEFLFTYRA